MGWMRMPLATERYDNVSHYLRHRITPAPVLDFADSLERIQESFQEQLVPAIDSTHVAAQRVPVAANDSGTAAAIVEAARASYIEDELKRYLQVGTTAATSSPSYVRCFGN